MRESDEKDESDDKLQLRRERSMTKQFHRVQNNKKALRFGHAKGMGPFKYHRPRKKAPTPTDKKGETTT